MDTSIQLGNLLNARTKSAKCTKNEIGLQILLDLPYVGTVLGTIDRYIQNTMYRVSAIMYALCTVIMQFQRKFTAQLK